MVHMNVRLVEAKNKKQVVKISFRMKIDKRL